MQRNCCSLLYVELLKMGEGYKGFSQHVGAFHDRLGPFAVSVGAFHDRGFVPLCFSDTFPMLRRSDNFMNRPDMFGNS